MYMYKYLSVILDDTADFNQTAELWRTITSSSFSQILFFLILTEFNFAKYDEKIYMCLIVFDLWQYHKYRLILSKIQFSRLVEPDC